MTKRSASTAPDVRTLRERLDLITERELFDLLDISAGTGKNRQSAGTLPAHFKVGRHKLYSLREVKEWLARRRVARGSSVLSRRSSGAGHD